MADDLVDNNRSDIVPTTEELLCNSVKMIRESASLWYLQAYLQQM